MSLSTDLRGRLFAAPPRQSWPELPVAEVEDLLQRAEDQIRERYRAAVANYEALPALPATADVALLLEREDEAGQIERDYTAELANLELSSAGLLDGVRRLNDLYATYGTRHTDYQQALERAWTGVAPAVETESEAQEALDRQQRELDSIREAILRQLNALGVSWTSENFDRWEGPVRDALYRAACADTTRRINPDTAPGITATPDEPHPPAPTTERVVREKSLSFWDLAMLVGGLGFGSSIGAAVRGISFNLDGWHLTPLFWLMGIIGTIAAFAIGKAVFPGLVSARTLARIDPQPFAVLDEAGQRQKEKQREEAERANLRAGRALALLYAAFIAIDFIGWTIAAVDYNRTFAYDEGAVLIPAWIPGLGVCLLTALMVSAKLASVFNQARRQSDQLNAEIARLSVDYRNAYHTYQRELAKYEAEQTAVGEYGRKRQAAEENAEHRMTNDRGIQELRRNVDRWNMLHDALTGSDCVGWDDDPPPTPAQRAEELAATAVASAEPQRRAVEETSDQIDAIFERVADLRRRVSGATP